MTRLPPPPTPARGWSEAAIDQLRALWGRPGTSAASIAERLGVSRNAVLGKAHRLGLSTPRAPRAPKPPRPPRLRRPRGPATRRAPREAPAECGLDPLVARLEALPRRACHWPIGDPRAEGFGFCGRPAREPPYCEVHRALAHRTG